MDEEDLPQFTNPSESDKGDKEVVSNGKHSNVWQLLDERYSKGTIKYCCVPGCRSNDTTAELRQLPFFDKRLRKKWLDSLRLVEPYALRYASSKPFLYVCYGHFDPRQFHFGAMGRKYLIRKAVPTRRFAAFVSSSKTAASGARVSDVEDDSLSTSWHSDEDDGEDSEDDDATYSSDDGDSRSRRKPSQPKIAKYCVIEKDPKDSRKQRYICKLDDIPFDSVQAATTHLSEAHHADMVMDYLECKVCEKKFQVRHIMAFKKHLQRNHESRKCRECGKLFCSSASASRHILQMHGAGEKVQCKICDKTLSSQSSLNQHMLLHGSKRGYTCQECGQRFRQAAGLSGHMRRVHDAPLVRKKASREESKE